MLVLFVSQKIALTDLFSVAKNLFRVQTLCIAYKYLVLTNDDDDDDAWTASYMEYVILKTEHSDFFSLSKVFWSHIYTCLTYSCTGV